MDSTTIQIALTAAIIAIAACIAAVIMRRQQRAGHNADDTQQEEPAPEHTDTADDAQTPPDFSGMKTKQLCKALLHELNCKVAEDEDDHDRMDFMFQGESFTIMGSDDSLMVTVYDFSWGSVPLDDIDEVSRLRKTINSVNFRFNGLAMVYTIDTDRNRMVVHTKRQFLLTPEIPSIIDYITAMLTGFFEVQRALAHELDRLRLEADNSKQK